MWDEKWRNNTLMNFQSVYVQYGPQLLRVEQLLHEAVKVNDSQLTGSAISLVEAGGKRIRPLFALICGQLGHTDPGDVESIACALELIHMATLVHDDVIDNAVLRRGKPTVRTQFGNLAAMYTGDFLFARAIGLLSEIHNPPVHKEISKAMVRMCEGEIEQIRDFFNWDQTLRVYLRRIERKTALLISVSCSLGAMVANVNQSIVQALRRFGYLTGMAFQIIDDVLDFSGTEDVVGKPVGNDLRQGNLTLPTLLAAKNTAAGAELRKLVSEGMDEAAAVKAIGIVQESGALEDAKQIALKYLIKARAVLNGLPVGQNREELIVVAEFINQRMF
jgi:heptaprenyl diphosphate synthase